MVVHVGEWFGDYLGINGHFSLCLNGAYLGELVGFEVSRAFPKVVPVELRDSRMK